MKKRLITKQAVYRVLKAYWNQYKTYPLYTSISFFVPSLGTILIFFVPPLVIARIVNVIASGQEISVSSVGGYIALFAGSWFLGEALWRFGMHFLIKLETLGLNYLGRDAFRRVTERDYDFYANNFVGSLTKQASAFSRGFEMITDTLSFNILNNVFPIIFAVIILWHYSWWLPVILLVSIAIALAIGIPIIHRRSLLVAERHEAASKVAGTMSDVLTNILAVKSFAKETQEQETFGLDVDNYTQKFKKTSDYQNLRFDLAMSPIYVLTNAIGLVAAIFFTKYLGLEAGTMIIVFSYYGAVTRVFWETNRIYRNIESAISEAAEFEQLLLQPLVVKDAESAGTLSAKDTLINFNNISFQYGASENNQSEPFLAGFNLEIKGNQKIGLVGPSGGGKTTITKLLLRFIDVQSGEISIAGQNISKVSQRSLREAIAYVPQEPLLFHRSLFENIAYGDESATEEEVKRAARLARADEFIDKLPNGYQTLVGERGIKLSGGQRQRVAIARALLKKAPILVLDEATSSLDSESEKYIQEGLWELMKNRTALVIAHRLSTIKHLDRIIVLDEGKIVQDGTHDELIKKKGLYATLWSHQSGEFLED